MFKKAKENKKGFTLAELLIVVAIIAVLVAISIPIFTTQLEKARESTDAANLRAAYATASVKVLESESKVSAGPVKMTQKTAGFASDVKDQKIGNKLLSDCSAAVNGMYYVTVDTNGNVDFETQATGTVVDPTTGATPSANGGNGSN